MKFVHHRDIGIVIFPASIAHDEMVNRLGGMADIFSAGFVTCDPQTIACHGESISLGIGSTQMDTTMVQACMRVTGKEYINDTP